MYNYKTKVKENVYQVIKVFIIRIDELPDCKYFINFEVYLSLVRPIQSQLQIFHSLQSIDDLKLL
jgi:hypothetical protein